MHCGLLSGAIAYKDSDEKGKILLKMVEIKARGAAKAEFTNVNEHFAATNNAEFGLFQQNLGAFFNV